MVELQEPLSALINHPQTFTKGKKFPQKIHIYDETLRDGEQMPGVAFSPAQKLRLARLLSDIGVDVILPAFISSSESDREGYRLILQEREAGGIRPEIEILTIARAHRGDIKLAADETRKAGVAVERVGILILSTTSDLHIKYKLGKTLLKYKGRPETEWLATPVEWYRAANIDLIAEHIAYAKELGFSTIEFASEDASRGNLAYLLPWAKACREAGGTRLCFSDTCGVFTPDGVDHYFPPLLKSLPHGFPVTAHFHNDLGLASINTVQALGHGASHASITANGIGERAGNGSIHQITVILKELYGIELPDFRYDLLWKLRREIEDCSGIPIQAHEPIVGHNVFLHESGIHTAGISIHPAIYQFLDEKTVGGTHGFVYGKHSGRAALEVLIDRHPLLKDKKHLCTDAVLGQILAEIKDRREHAHKDNGFGNVIDDYYRHLAGLGVSESAVAEIALKHLIS
ncbi:MAG: hypothetical protein PHZ00_07245 [Candidatus Peribacteraceae bacterium]|nr:hypothetical protein [Candidatus Peribacteraceae bacterium]